LYIKFFSVREKDFSHLELWKIFERIKGSFNSKATEKFLQTLKPYTDVEGLRQEVQLVEDFLAVEESLALYPFTDIEPYIKKSALQDATLSLEEILEIYKVIKLIMDARKALGAHVPIRKSLTNLLKNLHHFPQIEGIIESTVDQRGLIKDSASQELSTIRKKVRDLEREITRRLENILNRPDADRLLSDRIITIRNNRYVLPVKTTEINKIVGIVHGTSSSGYTTYLEPHSVVELNNHLVVLKEEEEEEVKKVLKRITSYIGEFSSKLMSAYYTLLKLDYLKAVARFSKETGGKFPRLSEGRIFLRSVRHPLLVFTKDHVVPIDIRIEGKRGLILTGPNTGGKTVALKTLGLCALMFQFALPIPLEEGELPVFEGIYTDIGDEQSIEQNLSTFSAHVSNLAEFLPLVNEKSLVLLDELGAGTDPMEGSALSIGVLEYLKDKKAYVFATTHHTPVKLYALESDYYTPASVSFDKETLEPTYHILYDAVGSSMAFEIATRFGMPEEVLEYARKKMPAEFEKFSKAKEDLEELIKEYQKKLREVEQAEEELERMKAEYSSLLALSEDIKEKAYREGMSGALQYLQEIEREAEELLKSARERQKIRQFVKEKKQEVMRELKEESVKVGDWVEFMGSRGRVLEVKEDRVQVSFGGVKAWVERQKLKKAHPPIEQEEYYLELKKGLPTEINLIGLSTEEALYRLEAFLKEAKALGIKSLKIIHGTGVLKRVVENFLENSELVVFHREGYPREGGAGVSVVFLEKP
jgi:DNA mismatch repair protein MutS2